MLLSRLEIKFSLFCESGCLYLVRLFDSLFLNRFKVVLAVDFVLLIVIQEARFILYLGEYLASILHATIGLLSGKGLSAIPVTALGMN